MCRLKHHLLIVLCCFIALKLKIMHGTLVLAGVISRKQKQLSVKLVHYLLNSQTLVYPAKLYPQPLVFPRHLFLKLCVQNIFKRAVKMPVA